MRARQLLLPITLGVASAVLGYALADALFADRLIALFAGAGDGEWEGGVVGDWRLQILCAGPLLVGLGTALAGLAMAVDRFVKVPSWLRYGFVATLSLVGSFVAYFPLQVLLLVGAAF